MKPRVAVVACLDTKGRETGFLADRLRAEGCDVHVVDVGIQGEPAFPAETTREQVATAGGTTLGELRARGDRGHAVAHMARGAAEVVRELYADGRIDGIIGAGGSANTTIATRAMQTLPVGVPKLMVSTLASGDVSPYVDTKDITMMYSVVDIAGINRISRRILDNAARAIAAMTRAASAPEPEETDRPLIAATMFGVTTPCVTAAKEHLEARGYEVLVFHATGSGGRAMEGLIADGFIRGVLDITTTELADELVGGILSAGPDRLTAAARHGVPQIVSIGAVDMCNFGPRDSVPNEFAARTFYEHNPTVTLMRTTAEENAEIGRRIAARVGRSRGSCRVVVPRRGVSAISTAGQPFHDPHADAACIDALRRELPDGIPCVELDEDINAPAFALACADALLELLDETHERPS